MLSEVGCSLVFETIDLPEGTFPRWNFLPATKRFVIPPGSVALGLRRERRCTKFYESYAFFFFFFFFLSFLLHFDSFISFV